MKKISKLLLILVFIVLLTGCKNNKEVKNGYNIKKEDDYLYYIEYDDYKYDKNLETITNVEDFGCSSVRNGNFYGRNFDFIYNDVPEFVVRVNASKDRHASIGVSILSDIHKGDDIQSEYVSKLELLPNFTLDGINDSGVISSSNVVPKVDTLPITGTNPGGENLHIGFIVRYVLDNASSADEAISLLRKRNIYGDLGDNYNLHVMIADKDKTYVVEFLDNEMVVKEKTGNEQIMTNYYVNLDYLSENSAGVERYKILQDNYNEGNTFLGMWNLMQRVKYSRAYLFDNDIPWYSEFLPQSALKDLDHGLDESTMELFDTIKKEYWVARTYGKRTPSNISFWFTTHNSTYDINERKLRVTIQENYDKYYEYSLNI